MRGSKTRRVYAQAALDGTTMSSTLDSFLAALSNLMKVASEEGREVLYDTLETEIDREVVNLGTLTKPDDRETYATIRVSAEAVRL